MAPIADLVGTFISTYATQHGLAPASMTLNGSRLTLQFAACIVLAAAVYAFMTLRWRSAEHPESATEEMAADA